MAGVGAGGRRLKTRGPRTGGSLAIASSTPATRLFVTCGINDLEAMPRFNRRCTRKWPMDLLPRRQPVFQHAESDRCAFRMFTAQPIDMVKMIALRAERAMASIAHARNWHGQTTRTAFHRDLFRSGTGRE